MAANFVPILTPLRGLAALFVVLFHAKLILFPQIYPEIKLHSAFLENAYLWVDLFFILSGYVMMHCYQQRFSTGVTGAHWANFIWLRLTRIYPLYLISFLVLLFWEGYKLQNNIGFFGGQLLNSWGLEGTPAFEGPFNRSTAIMANVLMLQGITDNGLTWNIVGWSLSIEWLCYLVFPFAVPMLLGGKNRIFGVLLLNALLLLCVADANESLDVTGGMDAFLRGWIGFSTGASLCSYLGKKTHRRWLAKPWLPLMCFVAATLVMHLSQNVGSLLGCYLIFVLLVASSAAQTQLQCVTNRLLDNRLTNWLGDLSYSMYLWHCVLLMVGVESINLYAPEALSWWYQQTDWQIHLTAIVLFVALLLLVSTASYYGLEKPIMRKLRRKPQPRTAAAL